jgi:hypothetical protein
MADIATGIRVIAKTKELTEKVDKLIQDSSAPAKPPITPERISAYTATSGSVGASAGAAPGAANTAGVDSNGNPIALVPAPVPDYSKLAAALSSILSLDKAALSAAQNNINSGGGPAPATQTDLSKTGQETTNNGGGTPFADQGTLGANNDDWNAIEAAMIANGSTQDEINQARRQFLNKELGVDEVGDVFTGTAGAKTASNEVQKGLVGVNPDDHTQARLIRLDGWQPTPSDTDAEAAFQDSWIGGAPVKKGFQLGYYWDNHIPGGPFYQESPGEAAQAYLDYYNSSAVQGVTGEYVVKTGLAADPLVGGHIVSYTLSYTTFLISTDAEVGPGTVGIDRVSCSIGTDLCPSVAPLETSFPLTNLGVVTYINGQFLSSDFDTEAPLANKSPAASVTIASLVTGETYVVEPAINGGFMLSQTTSTPYIMVYAGDGSLQNIVSPALKTFYSPRTN